VFNLEASTADDPCNYIFHTLGILRSRHSSTKRKKKTSPPQKISSRTNTRTLRDGGRKEKKNGHGTTLVSHCMSTYCASRRTPTERVIVWSVRRSRAEGQRPVASARIAREGPWVIDRRARTPLGADQPSEHASRTQVLAKASPFEPLVTGEGVVFRELPVGYSRT